MKQQLKELEREVKEHKRAIRFHRRTLQEKATLLKQYKIGLKVEKKIHSQEDKNGREYKTTPLNDNKSRGS